MNDQHPLPSVSDETSDEPGALPQASAPAVEDAQRQQLITLAAQAIDRFQDALVAGEEDPSSEELCAMNEVHKARAMSISDKEITAARRNAGTAYRVAHRTRGEELLPFLSKQRAFGKCEMRALHEYPGAELQWGTSSEDGQANRSSPWVLFRLDAQRDLIDTGYTVTPLPTTLKPVPGVDCTDEQT
ncbi:hypothetical protein ACFCY8_10370 [Streptomyces noursei]|uniref:hypothetical protein n=1 Tax=Streptomyces noursei TaxID=1971 RepID=UPI0035DCA319